jgi:hypothetical protein
VIGPIANELSQRPTHRVAADCFRRLRALA